MSRKPRVHLSGGYYHVMMRGNGGSPIFFSSADHTRFLLLMQEGLERYGHRIHAFCLMQNHVHLLIQVSDVPLSKIIQNLGFRYTRYINRCKQTTGHLFQGRYKAILIDADTYLLELIRYIHLNPVRAKVCSTPDLFAWSSHNSYINKQPIAWLHTLS
ncbi:MAG: transposase [Mariprofundaceae bacterium]|nr:transposase [Mariprofundaceae bacterium]